MRMASSTISLFLFLLGCCLICNPVDAVYKRWIKNTDFDNPSNWNTGNLPCPKDRIIFPAISPVVSINQDWTINHLVLPSDGIIVFNNDIIISFNENATLIGNCATPRDVTYNYTVASHWLNPTSWCLPAHDFDSVCFHETFQLHTEMVPCVTDQVIFSGFLRESHRSSFFVNLDIQNDMNVSSLQIGNQEFNTQSFQDYLNSTLGLKEFVRGPGIQPPILHMTGELCYDAAGCSCGTNASPWKERICQYLDGCPPPGTCETPRTPEGHCCPICGSYLKLVINTTSYNSLSISRVIEQRFINNKEKDYSAVKFTITRLSENVSQITFVSTGVTNQLTNQLTAYDGQKSSNLVAEFKEYILSDISTSNELGVLQIDDYQTSNTPETNPGSSSSTTTTSTTSTTQNPSSSTAQNPSSSSTKNPSTSATAITSPSKTATTSDSRATNQPRTDQQRVQTTRGSVEPAGGLVIGIVLLAVTGLLIVVTITICVISGYRRGGNLKSLDPMALSIKYDEDGTGGNVEIVRGLENPCFEGGASNGGGASSTSVQMDELNSSNSVRPATLKKKNLKKQKSNGFENPVYFDNKTDVATLGAAGTNGVADSTLNISNPLYDDTFLDEAN